MKVGGDYHQPSKMIIFFNNNKFYSKMNNSKLMKKERSEDPIFLNRKYDSAIMWVNYKIGSVIYSLTRLVKIDMEDMGNEGLLIYLQDEQDLFQFLSDNFCDFFEELQKREDGIPPTMLFDVKDKYKSVA